MYDVLTDIAYGAAPIKRHERAFSFSYKQRVWLDAMPSETKAVILAIAAQFANEGTEAFENSQIFNVQAVREAGGITALKKGGDAAALIRQAKERIFAA
jgi:hypothetical protein